MPTYKNSINFCYCNIGGLNTHHVNKLNDENFLREIHDYDVIILAETHVGYNTTIVTEQFDYFPVCRNISTNGRYYGGLAILRKKWLKDHIRIMQTACKNYQWLQFDKSPIRPIFMCGMHSPSQLDLYKTTQLWYY